jgi:TP901 family phage tail tape measure protein
LATVGVNIKDTNGDMKQMDQILEDLGSRWQTLGQDQKIALAQTVAGVRQYNQLISLMDNWDTFQENLNTAQGSEGALAAQAEIYAESWEAAQDRVTAAAEDIYSKLLNDEFFIDLTNILADIIDGFSKLIDSMGGLPGLLTMIGGIAVRVFKNQIGESIDRMVYNLKVSTGLVKKETDKMRDETLKALTSFGG